MIIKKLLILLIFSIIIPIAGLLFETYTYLPTFPYGGNYHIAAVLGIFTQLILVVIGVFGLIGGLISPKLTLWFGDKSRRRVISIYLSILVIALIVHCEMRFYIEDKIKQQITLKIKDEKDSIESLSNRLTIGQSTNDIKKIVKKYNPELILIYGDNSRFKRINDYPHNGETKYVIKITPNRLNTSTKIIIEMSDKPRELESISQKIILLYKDKVLTVKPAL